MTMQVEQRIIGDPFDERRSIVEPTVNDILCGRGGLSNHHPGNERYRSLIRTTRPFYQLCPKFTKLYVSKAIVQIVNDQGGRFLERSPKDGFWCIVPNKKAVHKTSQALRERDDEQASLMIPHALLEKLEKINEIPPKLKEMMKMSAGEQVSSPSEGCVPVHATSTADKTMKKGIPGLPNDAVFSNYVQLPQQSSQQLPSVPAPLEASLISPLPATSSGFKLELNDKISALEKGQQMRKDLNTKNLPKYYLPQNNLMRGWVYDKMPHAVHKESQMPDTIRTPVFSSFPLQPIHTLQYMPSICSPPSPRITMTKREIALELCRLYYCS